MVYWSTGKIGNTTTFQSHCGTEWDRGTITIVVTGAKWSQSIRRYKDDTNISSESQK